MSKSSIRLAIAAAAIAAVALSLGSCFTLPTPSSESDALLVVPIRHVNDTGLDYFGHYKLVVEVDGRRRVYTLLESTDEVVVPVNGNRSYALVTEFWFENGAQPGSRTTQSSVYVEPGSIVVNSAYLEITLQKRSTGGYVMSRRWRPVDQEMRDETLDRLIEYRNAERWSWNR